MAHANKEMRRKRWEKNPHCYWCGIPTIWYDRNGGKQPDNAATLDHIRSRYVPMRAQQDGQWKNGIIVLACHKCNQDRCTQEQLFLAQENPSLLHKKSGSPPSHKRLRSLQSKLSTGIAKFIEKGGTIIGNGASSIINMSKELLREYKKIKKFRC